MATALELLFTSNGEEHIVIGSNRYITVPESLKRIAVQFDHDIETVTFDCPRYWDGIDLSKMIIYINYKLPNGDLDAYPAKNINVDGNIMHFDWTISNKLTQYKGTIKFLVCIKKTDAEGSEVNHWNSELCSDMYVSEGMECEELEELENSDLVTQLLERMTVVENINVQADEMQTLHDETLEAAKLASDESDYIKNSYANAYKQTVSGEVIRVDDVSPLEHTVDVKVKSKNLIPYPYAEETTTRDGVTFTVESDGSITIVGTPTRNTSFNIVMQYQNNLPVIKGRTYTITCESTFTNATGYVFLQNWSEGAVVDSKSVRNGSVTFTASKNGSIQIGVVVLKEQIYDETIYVYMEEGSIASEYIPYVDPSTVTLMTSGKNFWYSKNLTYPRTVSGVTIDYDATKQIYTFNGTSTSPGDIYIRPNGTHIMRINAGETWTLKVERLEGTIDDLPTCSGKMSPLVNTQTYTNTIHANSIELKSTKTYDEAADITKMYFYIYAAGIVFNNFKCRVQFEPNNEATDFEKAIDIIKYTPSTDGSVDSVSSIHPYMVLKTNTLNTTIDLTYNRDNNKVIGDISTALDTLLAMQSDTITLLNNMAGGVS